MRRLIVVVALIAVAGACGDGASPSAPVGTTAPVATAPPVQASPAVDTTGPPVVTAAAIARGDIPERFAVATIGVAGEEWTVALAASPSERQQGLMLVTDLGDLDGMLFVFDSDGTGGFWMKDTLIPLEVAFFTAGGVLVDVLSMVPCEADPCPSYVPAGAYRYALEAEPGRLAALPAGAILVVGDR